MPSQKARETLGIVINYFPPYSVLGVFFVCLFFNDLLTFISCVLAFWLYIRLCEGIRSLRTGLQAGPSQLVGAGN